MTSSSPHAPAALLAATAHRPWPLPARPWTMTQSWHDLLFAHWPIAPEVMRASVPAELELEEESLTRAAGFEFPKVAPHLRFARRLDVLGWPLEKV